MQIGRDAANWRTVLRFLCPRPGGRHNWYQNGHHLPQKENSSARPIRGLRQVAQLCKHYGQMMADLAGNYTPGVHIMGHFPWDGLDENWYKTFARLLARRNDRRVRSNSISPIIAARG